ncbi:helix-turn-helix domain-containing protein [Sphingomonas sp. IC-11]|uniref:helix-turn-helix domain-containing protein n=1 Tax=Sphingomonas sp. IC-11 TaxID=2898528 RepID=UPI001E59A86A|nr:helix-turn-helix transcriptional regulator [Sphingomonas sp. IC-11]MCD2316928.1 helix-turn-helix domain-containing protein [Sphingomonas sp. IC-11]
MFARRLDQTSAVLLRSTLAKNLQRLRRERDLSQEALADRVGIDRTYVSALERQVYSATIDMVERLAAALAVEPVELLAPSSVVTQDPETGAINVQLRGRRRPLR